MFVNQKHRELLAGVAGSVLDETGNSVVGFFSPEENNIFFMIMIIL